MALRCIVTLGIFAALNGVGRADPPAPPPSTQVEKDLRLAITEIRPTMLGAPGDPFPEPAQISNIELLPVAENLAKRLGKEAIPDLVRVCDEIGDASAPAVYKKWGDNPFLVARLAMLTLARMGERHDVVAAYDQLFNQTLIECAYIYATYLPDAAARKVMEAALRRSPNRKAPEVSAALDSAALEILQIAGDAATLDVMDDILKSRGQWSDTARAAFARYRAALRDRLLESDVKKRQAMQDLERRWFQARPLDHSERRTDLTCGIRAVVLAKHGVRFPPEFLCEKLFDPAPLSALLARCVLMNSRDEAAIPRLLQIAALKPDTPTKELAYKLANEVLGKYDPDAIARARKPSSKP